MVNLEITKDKTFFSQIIKIKKKYSNLEFNLHQYFYKKTKLHPENIIVLNQFIFFFIKNEDYFKAKLFLNSIRKQLEKKILLIRAENNLIKLLFGFFPDPYIHDIKIEINEKKIKTITICFISFEERGIAIGRSGDYIKAVNEIFEKYIIFEKKEIPFSKIKCELVKI